MQNVTKIRCPYCSGKIAIDEDYYQELVGTVINCPHCGEQLVLPENSETPQDISGSHSLDRTQEIKMSPAPTPPVFHQPAAAAASDDGARHCPHCGVEVGKRDRVCITCGNKIPLPEPPAGFSQIRA